MEVKVDVKAGSNQVLRNGTSVCEINVPDLNARQYLYLPYDDFHRYFGAREGISGDLLLVAGSCYVIDQLIPRAAFADNWTRELEVALPVAEPERWNSIAAALSKTLAFLTGDRWSLSFHQRQGPIYQHRHRRLRRIPIRTASAVCLFSGGLDSLVGAISYLSNNDENLILVGHYDLGSVAKKVQFKLAEKLAQVYSPSRLNLIQARVGPIQSISSGTGIHTQVSMPGGVETTLRSRSLVFLALGLYVAQQQKSDAAVPLLIPENGLIALNPSLTPSRLGSCSSRTAHPLFLSQFQVIVHELGLKHPIRNPFAEKTKGEILAYSTNFDLVKQLAADTISCAHPTRRQGWIRRNVTHCGYCIPCIFRRAGLHRVGLDQGETYGYDVCAGELSLDEAIASDLRAMLFWLHSAHTGELTPEKLAGRLALPSGMYSNAVSVLKAGIDEITQFIQDKAAPSIRQWAGLE